MKRLLLFHSAVRPTKKKEVENKISIQMKHKSNCSRFQIRIQIELLLKSMRVNWKTTTYCSFGIRFGFGFDFGFDVSTNHRDNNKTTNNKIMTIDGDDRRMNKREPVSFHLMF